MQQQRWRWLWIWVGVLVAGCGQVWSPEGTAAPTREPTLPLLGYTLLPPSLTPSIRPAHTATPLVTIDSSSLGGSPVALYLAASGPTCYETAVGSLTCLGQVRNLLDVPVEHVVVEVQLLDQHGILLASGDTMLARMLLPAGLAGPYRVLFDTIPDGYAGAYAFVISAERARNPEYRYANLMLRQVAGNFVNNQYEVTLSILNEGPFPARQIAVTMTLLDKSGQVTGFRQMALDEERYLAAGETLSMTVKVIPQGENTVAFDTFVEGRLAPN